MGKSIKPGQRVRVPWGLQSLEAVVLDVYGSGDQWFAMVSVPVRGSLGETLETQRVSYPLESLEPLETATG